MSFQVFFVCFVFVTMVTVSEYATRVTNSSCYLTAQTGWVIPGHIIRTDAITFRVEGQVQTTAGTKTM